MKRPKFTDAKYQYSNNKDIRTDFIEYNRDLEKYCDELETQLKISNLENRKLKCERDERLHDDLNAMYNCLDRLCKLGYPHSFQHEKPHIVKYMYKLTEIIEQAMDILKEVQQDESR